MRSALTRHLLLATVTALTVSACATPLMQAREGFGIRHDTGMNAGPGHRGRQGPHHLFKGLNLSAAQQQAIRGILQAERPARQGNKGQAMRDLQATLLAPHVDAAKLESQLRQWHDKQDERLDRFVRVATKIRDVLTPEQRAAFAKKQPPKAAWANRFAGGFAPRPMERLLSGLTLTTTQQQAADKLKGAMKDRHEARKGQRTQMHQALADFARSGDAGALRQALQAQAPTPPIREIAQLAASLDQSQRQQIANRMREQRQRWQSRHHGGHGHQPQR